MPYPGPVPPRSKQTGGKRTSLSTSYTNTKPRYNRRTISFDRLPPGIMPVCTTSLFSFAPITNTLEYQGCPLLSLSAQESVLSSPTPCTFVSQSKACVVWCVLCADVVLAPGSQMPLQRRILSTSNSQSCQIVHPVPQVISQLPEYSGYLSRLHVTRSQLQPSDRRSYRVWKL